MSLLFPGPARDLRCPCPLAGCLALVASYALAAASSPRVLPVEPDGGIGGEIVLPVEPDRASVVRIVLPVEPDGGIGTLAASH